MSRWHRWVGAWSVFLLCLVPFTVGAQSSDASEPITIDVKAVLPLLGQAIEGTFSLQASSLNDRSIDGQWTFVGEIDGQAARARGEGQGIISTKNSLALEVTSITNWDMGLLPKPVVPANVTVSADSDIVEISWERLNVTESFKISPALSLPLAAGDHYSLTATSDGAEAPIQALPTTGSGATNLATQQIPHSSWLAAGLALAAITVFGLGTLHQRRDESDRRIISVQ